MSDELNKQYINVNLGDNVESKLKKIEFELCDLMSCSDINNSLKVGKSYENKKSFTLPHTKKKGILQKGDFVKLIDIDSSKDVTAVRFEVLSGKFKGQEFCFSSIIFISHFVPEAIVLDNQNKANIKNLKTQKEKLKKILDSKKIDFQRDEVKKDVNGLLDFVKKAIKKIKKN